MLAFLMTGIVQALCYDTPLHCEVLIAKYGQTLVNRPTDRAMIHYDIMTSAASQSVALVVGYLAISQSKAQIANDVVRSYGNGIVCQADAIARSRLSSNGGVLCKV
jgi:hypothetical protein